MEIGPADGSRFAYRPEGELDAWLLKDPILQLQNAMIASDPQATSHIALVREQVKLEVIQARDRALSWPEPPVEARFEDVYS